MAKSIMQNKKECWYCGTTQNLECHHQRRDFDLRLRRAAQSIFVDTHSQEEWMEEVGRNYI